MEPFRSTPLSLRRRIDTLLAAYHKHLEPIFQLPMRFIKIDRHGYEEIIREQGSEQLGGVAMKEYVSSDEDDPWDPDQDGTET